MCKRTTYRQSPTEQCTPVLLGEGDVSYSIDIHAEQMVEEFFNDLNIPWDLEVVMEGMGRRTFSTKQCSSRGKVTLLIDPIDGTREIMYDKRSAWVLTGVAVNPRPNPTLSDIDIAIQTEIPTGKQDRLSVLWASKGRGAFEDIIDFRTQAVVRNAIPIKTSTATSLEHGFVSFVNFFPGTQAEISTLAEHLIERVLGPVREGGALAFNDQYISTGGQIYLLATGRYRLVADLRPDMEVVLSRRNRIPGLCCHPYDLSTALIAIEAGAEITDTRGKPLSYPLDAITNCSWIGYANKTIRGDVEPALRAQLARLVSCAVNGKLSSD